MDTQIFIDNYREAFGHAAELPIAFWYSDTPEQEEPKTNGCLFKCIKKVRDGIPVSLAVETIGCGGGKLYTGFTGMPEHMPTLVSQKERYKQTPEMVLNFVQQLGISRTKKKYLHLARIDQIETLQDKEGILFLATPDILAGLTTWAFFDNNAPDAVVSSFGSGCSTVITQPTLENQKGGRRTFLGFLDPSVRPHVEANILSYTIPMSRFKEMYQTMRSCCLFNTHAWTKIKERINS